MGDRYGGGDADREDGMHNPWRTETLPPVPPSASTAYTDAHEDLQDISDTADMGGDSAMRTGAASPALGLAALAVPANMPWAGVPSSQPAGLRSAPERQIDHETPHIILSAGILECDLESLPRRQLMEIMHKYESGEALEADLIIPAVVHGPDTLRQSTDLDKLDDDDEEEEEEGNAVADKARSDPTSGNPVDDATADATTVASTSNLATFIDTKKSSEAVQSPLTKKTDVSSTTTAKRRSRRRSASSSSSLNGIDNTLRRHIEDDRLPAASKSQTISNIQSVFTDTQKIAYVGLCYLCIAHYRRSRVEKFKKAAAAYDKWSEQFMEKLYVYLDLVPEERKMIMNLAEHGLVPSDLSIGLLNDAKRALSELEAQQAQSQTNEQKGLYIGKPVDVSLQSASLSVSTSTPTLAPVSEGAPDKAPSDVRYKILSHLFILSIADGHYDARARTILRKIAADMEIPYLDLMRLESLIADQLRLYEDHDQVRPDQSMVGQRNKVEGRNRWLLAGLATLAGGAVIGVTAGLAAPFIGAGIGAAFTTFGVTGVTGLTSFMAGTGGLAIITTGGVLTGGGMSGFKMMKRTRGIEEFTFTSLEDALNAIEENRSKRQEERRKRRKTRADASSLLKEKADAAKRESDAAAAATDALKSASTVSDKTEMLWEMSSIGDMDLGGEQKLPVTATDVKDGDTEPPKESRDTPVIELATNSPDKRVGDEKEKTEEEKEENDDDDGQSGDDEQDVESDEGHGMRFSNQGEKSQSRQTNVLITVAGWVTHDADDYTIPFSTLVAGENGDQYTLVWESKVLQELGSALRILVSEVASFILQQGLQATLLPVLMAGLTGPLWMIKLTYLVDNPWGNALTKAEKAGRVLADALMGQIQGNRPVTLVGFSLGARLIYFCLLELAAHGAHGIVEEAYIFGTPVIGTKRDWERIASVVSGRVINGYTQNDMMLGVLYRASSALWSDVAGLRPVMDVPGIDNMDLSDIVRGHLDYRTHLPKIMKKCGLSVSSETFYDIDDEEEEERQEVEAERVKEKEMREELARIKKDEADRKRIEKGASAAVAAAATAAKRKSAGNAASMGGSNATGVDTKYMSTSPSAISPASASVSIMRSSPIESSAKSLPGTTNNLIPGAAAGLTAAKTSASPSTSSGWFSSRNSPITNKAQPKAVLSQDQIVQDELRQMSELEDLMHVYWQPREIHSTLPPLVISGVGGNATTSVTTGNSMTDTVLFSASTMSSAGVVPVSLSAPQITSTASSSSASQSPGKSTHMLGTLQQPVQPASGAHATSTPPATFLLTPHATQASSSSPLSSTPSAVGSANIFTSAGSDEQLVMDILEHQMNELGAFDVDRPGDDASGGTHTGIHHGVSPQSPSGNIIGYGLLTKLGGSDGNSGSNRPVSPLTNASATVNHHVGSPNE